MGWQVSITSGIWIKLLVAFGHVTRLVGQLFRNHMLLLQQQMKFSAWNP